MLTHKTHNSKRAVCQVEKSALFIPQLWIILFKNALMVLSQALLKQFYPVGKLNSGEVKKKAIDSQKGVF